MDHHYHTINAFISIVNPVWGIKSLCLRVSTLISYGSWSVSGKYPWEDQSCHIITRSHCKKTNKQKNFCWHLLLSSPNEFEIGSIDFWRRTVRQPSCCHSSFTCRVCPTSSFPKQTGVLRFTWFMSIVVAFSFPPFMFSIEEHLCNLSEKACDLLSIEDESLYWLLLLWGGTEAKCQISGKSSMEEV